MMPKKDENKILLVEGNPNEVELALDALHGEHLCSSIQMARGGEVLAFRFCRNAHRERDPDNRPQQDQLQDVVQGYQRGANRWIQEPVDFDQFCSTIKQLGCYSLLVNQAAPPKALEKMTGGRPA